MAIKAILSACPSFSRAVAGFLGLLLFILIAPSQAYSQVKVYSLPRSHSAANTASTQRFTSGRTKQVVPLTLPFFDDFSKPTVVTPANDLYPDTARWESGFTVWVSSGIAVNAPTINTATFDGLDSAGFAYNPNDIFVSGLTDSLVSRKINLSESAPGPVTIAERNSIYLSFFYQWRGNGEAPDPSDHLRILFRDNQGQWDHVLTITPSETTEGDVFYPVIIKVEQEEHFHKDFQFQIQSYGRQSGPYDTWNIDYIYLNRGRDANDLSFPDRAAASAISPLFKPYSAIPYYHFVKASKEGILDSVTFDVQNLKNLPSSTNYRARMELTTYTGNNAPVEFAKTLVASQGVKGVSGALNPFERVRTKLGNLPDTLDFDTGADSLFVTLKMKVISNDSTDADRFKFLPNVNLQINDTVSTTYALKDFYAYDDGVAEYAAGLIETGNFLAYEFNLLPHLHDTLKLLEAIDIYFPPYGLPNTQNVDFYVFADRAGVPGARLISIPSRPISSRGINQFQRIRLLPALQITTDRFYVGWKQPVAGEVLVGLDKSNDTGNRIFTNVEGNDVPDAERAIWDQNTTITGSLMIRPVFGTGEVDPETGIEEEIAFYIYPNPSRGSFYIDGEFDTLDILSVTGQPVSFQSDLQHGRAFVQLNVSSGLYLVRCRKGARVLTHKLIISR